MKNVQAVEEKDGNMTPIEKLLELLEGKKKELEEQILNPIYRCPDCKFEGKMKDFDYDEDACEMDCKHCNELKLGRREPVRITPDGRKLREQIKGIDTAITQIKNWSREKVVVKRDKWIEKYAKFHKCSYEDAIKQLTMNCRAWNKALSGDEVLIPKKNLLKLKGFVERNRSKSGRYYIFDSHDHAEFLKEIDHILKVKALRGDGK